MFNFPAVDRVTGHVRGCAREQACLKSESMWTCKYGSPLHPIPTVTVNIAPT